MDTSREFNHDRAWPPGYGPNGNQHPRQGAVPSTPNNPPSSLHTPSTEERTAASGSQHPYPPPGYHTGHHYMTQFSENVSGAAPEHRAPPPFPPFHHPVPPFALVDPAREDASSAAPPTQPTGSSFLDDHYSSDEPEFEPAAPKESASKQSKGKKRATDPADTSTGKTPKKAKVATPSAGNKPVPRRSHTASSSSKAQGGRQAGSSNYSDDDLKALFKFVRQVLPIGQKAWQDVAERFNTWAKENGRPRRECRPLKAKYDGLVRIASEKPTGSANAPWWVKRVLRIEDLINEKSHIKEFNDEDGAEPAVGSEISESDNGEGAEQEVDDDDDEEDLGANDPGSDSSVVEVDGPAAQGRVAKGGKGGRTHPTLKAVHGQRGVSASRPPTTTRRTQARDFLGAISASLDPAAREARDEKRLALRLLQEEVNRLAQENRDLRQRNDLLTDRTHELSLQLQEERAEVKRLQGRIDTFEMMQSLVARSQGLALNAPIPFAPPPANIAPPHWPRSAPSAPVMPMHSAYAPAPPPAPSTPPRNEPDAGPSNVQHQHSNFMRCSSPAPVGLETLASVASGSRRSDVELSKDGTSFTVTVSPSRPRYYKS